MIYIKSCINSSLKKYGIIMGILFIIILLLVNFYLSVDYHIENEKKSEVYRTLLFSPNSDWNVEEALKKYEKYIESIDDSDDEFKYMILFSDNKYFQDFLDEYSDNISKVSIAAFDVDSKYEVVRISIQGLIIVSLIIILFLIILFSVNIIYNMEKDISLYKLIGFRNSNIIVFTLAFIYCFYLMLYFMSIAFVLFLNKVIGMNGIEFLNEIRNIYLLNFRYYINIWGVINLAILLSFIRIVVKIKRNSPMTLIKSY